MRTMKLAVSVYALTLVLGANNALGATTFGKGSASPSCNATTFNIRYSDNMLGCFFGYKSSDTNTFSTESLTWDETFKTKAALPEGSGTCLGYELTGWSGDEVNVNDGVLELDKEYTSNSETWDKVPVADGSSVWDLYAQWTATTSEIELDSNDADVASDPGSLYRKGVQLFLDENSPILNYMSNTQWPLTTLPQKYGYTFKGYFATPDRATAVGNFWANGEDKYTEEYCVETSNMPQSEWAKGTSSTAVRNCAWIKSDGHLGNMYVGTAAAKNGTDMTLYAAWEPREFSVSFVKGGMMSSFCDDNDYDPDTGECSFTQNGETYYYPADAAISNMPSAMNNCRWEQGNCTLDSGDIPTIQGGMYAFTRYAIMYNLEELGWIYKSDLEKGTVDLTKKLSNMAKNVWDSADSNGGVLQLRLVAQWAKNNTTMNFYASKTDTEPFARYKMVTNEGAAKLYREVRDAEGKLSYEDVPLISGMTAPTMDTMSDAGVTMPDNAILRGFVIADSKQNVPDMVSKDTPGVTYDTAEENPFLISNYLGVWNATWNQDNGMKMSEAILDKRAGTAGTQSYVNVYGIWAQKCDDDTTLKANKVATCDEQLGNFGSVSYVITCDTGYNLDGYSEINK